MLPTELVTIKKESLVVESGLDSGQFGEVLRGKYQNPGQADHQIPVALKLFRQTETVKNFTTDSGANSNNHKLVCYACLTRCLFLLLFVSILQEVVFECPSHCSVARLGTCHVFKHVSEHVFNTFMLILNVFNSCSESGWSSYQQIACSPEGRGRVPNTSYDS